MLELSMPNLKIRGDIIRALRTFFNVYQSVIAKTMLHNKQKLVTHNKKHLFSWFYKLVGVGLLHIQDWVSSTCLILLEPLSYPGYVQTQNENFHPILLANARNSVKPKVKEQGHTLHNVMRIQQGCECKNRA